MSTAVGFVGLGTMGRPMALHLAQAGIRDLDLRVLDTSRERAREVRQAGANWAESPADLAACDILLFMVPDLPQVEAVLEAGVLSSLTGALTVVVCSTVSPSGIVQAAARWREASGGLISVVDAPVSGGEEGAKAGTLSIMVGGEAGAVAPVLPLLAPMGRAVHLGPLGSGQVAKACNQLIVAAELLALGEVSVIAERNGLDLAQLFDLLSTGLAASRVLETKSRRLAERDFAASGPAKFLVKDLGFALAAAEATGVQARELSTCLQAFTELTERGLGDYDTAIVRRYVEEIS